MIDINDINDHRIKSFLSLKTNSNNYQTNNYQSNYFIAESEKVVLKLFQSCIRIDSIFATKEYYNKHKEIIDRIKIPPDNLFTAEKTLMNQIVGYNLHQGIMAVGEIPHYATMDNLDNSIVIMNKIVDSENVGTIIRNANAFGFNSLIFDNATSNPYLRRAVRVSMGNVFDMKVHKSDDIILTIEKLKSNGYQIIASEINSTSKPIQKLDIKKQHAIIFGNESHGIESNVLDLCDEIIHIPTTENTKSINVATSSGIMLFYLNNINFFR